MPAPAVLYLPGMMCDARLWAPQTAALPYPAFHADTTRADNFADMAEQALADAPPEFAVVGLSMGGILAFEIWRRAAERVTHMAILDSNPHPDAPARRSLRMEQIEIAINGGLRELAVEAMKPLYLAESHRDDDALLETILDMAMTHGPEVFQRQSLALRDRVDSAPTLPTIDCPTLVLCGVEDRLCPVEYHEFMADEMPDARLAVVEDCGHIASLEQPETVTRELQQLLDR